MKTSGFKNFKETLYPISNFDWNNTIKKIKNDGYFQVQFDFTNISTKELYNKYNELINLLDANDIPVINRLTINLNIK
jgi:hypothetical protein